MRSTADALQPALSIERLYEDHHRWLSGWLRRRLGDSRDAADLAQDTFLRILTSWQKQAQQQEQQQQPAQAQRQEPQQERRQALPGPDDPTALREPRAYLATVANRLLANHWRRLSLEQAFLASLAGLPEPETPSVEQRFLILETLQEIDVLLDRLAPRARTAFLLAQLEGLTYAEIAEQLQVNVRTIKRYMAAAYEECLLLMA